MHVRYRTIDCTKRVNIKIYYPGYTDKEMIPFEPKKRRLFLQNNKVHKNIDNYFQLPAFDMQEKRIITSLMQGLSRYIICYVSKHVFLIASLCIDGLDWCCWYNGRCQTSRLNWRVFYTFGERFQLFAAFISTIFKDTACKIFWNLWYLPSVACI